VRASARRLGYETYRPVGDYRAQLEKNATLVEDRRTVRDRRPSTELDGRDVTLTAEGLEDVLAGLPRGLRVLEVGPKYGVHALRVDRALAPQELVFCDFEADAHLHAEWVGELSSPYRFVYGDLAGADELLELEPFDLVLFLGVLYHSIHHLRLLSRLNRAMPIGGLMLLETTIDPRPDASIRLSWQDRNQKAKGVPTFDAVRLLLSWTGFRAVTHFAGYRPGSSEILLLAEKTDEVRDDDGLADVVLPHREPVAVASLGPWSPSS
jgi:SAM-dependent methyltransferase